MSSKQEQDSAKADDDTDDDDGKRPKLIKPPFKLPKNIEEVWANFKATREWHTEKFSMEEFSRLEKEHRKIYGIDKIKPKGKTYDGFKEEEQQAILSNSAATNKPDTEYSAREHKPFFFTDPDHPGTFFSMPGEEARQEAIERGFMEVQVGLVASKDQIHLGRPQQYDVAPPDQPAPSSDSDAS
jgi:hypothetical protein